MEKGEIKVKINGILVGRVNSEGKAIGLIFSHFLNNYRFMSIAGIKHQLLSLAELIDEIQEKPKKKILELTESMRKMANNAQEKTPLLTFITNLILNAEGMGLLHGFGVGKIEMNEGKAKVKTRVFIDPEKQPIRKSY